ncbi:esterase [Curvibacter sp. CHRR-16]|uniref:esterase n=1 Tax=Curvibacter sp. CHRR-16 TaxID=2835872 RepID=UPI001BDB2F2F|nr:esterase [Curvibacter sp. CHRR-16]MBT0570353.1 esterase [Curvibacter sp. CHRR-16]
MTSTLIIQQPTAPVAQLFLLFHGVGATPQSMEPVGAFLAQHFPQAAIVSVAAPYAWEGGTAGRQWFSVQGITEENRIDRIAAVMPEFVQCVQQWQQHFGVEPAATALVGFSQGGSMALESSQQDSLLAGRVVSLSGRFARMPQLPHAHCTVHLFHGKADPLMPYNLTVMAAEHLVELGADITADVIPHLGHTVNGQVLALLLERLQGHVPKHIWLAAQQAAASGADEEKPTPLH